MPFIHTSLQSCVFCMYLNLTSIIANRKKAEARQTGGGPPPPPLTEAEEMPSVRTVDDPLLRASLGGVHRTHPRPRSQGPT